LQTRRAMTHAPLPTTLLVLAASSALACNPPRQDPAKTTRANADGSTETTSMIVPRGDESRGTKLATETSQGKLETVALFDGAMPTGVAVSQGGRVFVSFPRWGDSVEFTVAEVKDGSPVAYPSAEINRWPGGAIDRQLVSVQSVVVDPKDRLWLVDAASVKFEPAEPGGPKLVGVDLAKNAPFRVISFPRDVALPTSYLNDVRFDYRVGRGGMAFITDSSHTGPNGIIVVDLDSGKSWRKLHDHPSTKAEKGFLPIVEGRPLMHREAGKPAKALSVGADGIAISKDGKLLYYSPLASRRLYSVSIDALINEKLPDAQVAATVKDLGEKGASDGLESDAEGRVYVTNYEHNAVLRRNPDGSFETIAADPRLLWPDTLSLAQDGFLYVMANQLERQAMFHDGHDLREKPYALFRIKVDAAPVLLR
jgi:sugar lactone lactonase YvrE